MAWSVADDTPAERRGPIALGDLESLLSTLPAASWSDLGADVLVCWALCDRLAPATIIEGAQRGASVNGSTIEALANAWGVAALVARFESAPEPPPPTLAPPPELDWEALGDWYARAAPMALPGRSKWTLVAERAEDLLRALGQALLADDLVRAGRLLRWLACAPTSVDRPVADALSAALERTRSSATRAFDVIVAYRLWRGRSDKKLGAATAPPPRPPAQPNAGQAALIDPALEWLLAHGAEFVAGDASSTALRRLGELAVLGDLLLRKADERARPRWRDDGKRLLAQAWQELDGGDALVRVIERDPALSTVVTIYWPLHRNGMRNPRLERAIADGAKAIGQPAAYLAAHAMRAIGLVPPWTFDEAYAWTAVARARPPWRLSKNEAYIITHIAYYDAAAGEQRGQAYFARWLPVWLRYYEETGWNDLLAEMIYAWHCVEDECCPPRAWQALQAAQRPDGCVPFWRAGDGADYHSTLVTLIAALSCRHV